MLTYRDHRITDEKARVQCYLYLWDRLKGVDLRSFRTNLLIYHGCRSGWPVHPARLAPPHGMLCRKIELCSSARTSFQRHTTPVTVCLAIFPQQVRKTSHHVHFLNKAKFIIIGTGRICLVVRSTWLTFAVSNALGFTQPHPIPEQA